MNLTPATRAFLLALRQRHEQAASGVVHLYTESNAYGRIALQGGEVTHVSLHTQRGAPALAALASSVIRSQRFEADAQLPPTEGLPPTPELLSQLGADALPATTTVAAAAPATAGARPAASTAAAATGPAVPDAAAALIELELARELGPMAASLVKECRPKARDALHLAEQLAEQLLPQEGAAFLARVSELLRSVKTQ